MRLGTAIFFLALLPAVAIAQTTMPVDITASVARLDDRDPEARQSAREALMTLTRDDLPRLRDAVAGSRPKTVVRDALRDVVLHVYLTGKHNFAGKSTPYVGIVATPEFGEAPTVLSRTIGYDAYRVLRTGDVIVGMRLPPNRSTENNAFVPIGSMGRLKELLNGTVVGQWIDVRLCRDGSATPIDVQLRIGPYSPSLRDSRGANPSRDEAMNYWNKEFAPALVAPPTSRPAPK